MSGLSSALLRGAGGPRTCVSQGLLPASSASPVPLSLVGSKVLARFSVMCLDRSDWLL